MKKIYLIVIFVIITIFSFAQNNNKFNTYWKNGIRIESTDGNFKLKFGGIIMLDGMKVFPDKVLDTIITNKTGVEFRRLRVYSSGLIYKNIKYKLQFDFAGGQARIKDAFIDITKIPVIGNIQVGYFKEPFGLELLTSNKYLTMLERSLTDPFTPNRNTGLMLYNTELDKRLFWAAGYFFPSNSFGKYMGNQYHLTARLTGLPIYNTEGKYKVLHLGAAYTYQYYDNSEYKLAARPESHMIPKLVAAEIDRAKAVNQFGGEVVLIYGPLSIQGEYITSTTLASDSSALQKDKYNFSAYYATISWFITGEHRCYDPSYAVIGRVKPKKNFGSKGGPGAFELALRYSAINIDYADVKGGQMADVTLGLNWYLNPATRFMFNYVLTDVKNTGKANIFQVRFQIDF